MTRRSLALLLAVTSLLVVSACAGGAPRGASRPPTRGYGDNGGARATASGAAVRFSAVRMRWRLPVGISREVVVPDGRHLLVAGGLTAGQVSAAGVFLLNPGTGSLTTYGTLADGVHDAAGAMVAGALEIFGGGSSASSSRVQRVAPGVAGTIAGHLPTARSDLVAARMGGQTYLLGGYDGRSLLPQVLATSDGQHLRTVASLPVPVRYPAVAALEGKVYLFGGETASGRATSAVQEVDPSSGRARVVGHLPLPVVAASGFALGGALYVAGGRIGNAVTSQVWRFAPGTDHVSRAGRLPYGVSNAGTAVLDGRAYLVGGETPAVVGTVIRCALVGAPYGGKRAPAPHQPPFVGDLLIADRGNNRLLLVNAAKRILWRYPSPNRPAPKGGFYFPDDAFFTQHGTGIITNEENNNTIVRLAFPSGRLVWRYGHPRAAGSAPGYLHQPDDAYLLRNGQVVVADALNCRILFINPDKTVARQIGTTGNCTHAPPTSIGYPNGDTPLANGDILVSEINGSYVTELTPRGGLVWTVHLPISYPSDPQQLGPDRFLVADYARPGGLYVFNRAGRILWSYHPSHGRGMLNHPSLAERLPNGFFAVTDDYRDRVVVIDPRTGRIVWQYGITGVPGTAPGHLNTPDGFDLLAPNHTTPTHPTTG